MRGWLGKATVIGVIGLAAALGTWATVEAACTSSCSTPSQADQCEQCCSGKKECSSCCLSFPKGTKRQRCRAYCDNLCDLTCVMPDADPAY